MLDSDGWLQRSQFLFDFAVRALEFEQVRRRNAVVALFGRKPASFTSAVNVEPRN